MRARRSAPRWRERSATASSRRRQPHREARAQHLARLGALGGRAVLRPQPAVMRFDDLLGDRQAEAGILAEILMRAIGVEAIEDLLHRLRVDARSVVLDHDIKVTAVAPAGDADVAALG